LKTEPSNKAVAVAARAKGSDKGLAVERQSSPMQQFHAI